MKNESERLWWYCVLAGFIYFEHQEFIFIYVYDELLLSRLHHLQIIYLYKVVKIDLRDKYHITWCDRIGCSIVTHFPLKMTFQVCKRGKKKEEFTVWRPIENIFWNLITNLLWNYIRPIEFISIHYNKSFVFIKSKVSSTWGTLCITSYIELKYILLWYISILSNDSYLLIHENIPT